MGEFAAVITALCWGLTSLFFTAAGRKVGSATVNRLRLVAAVVILVTIHWLIYGQPLPLSAGPQPWIWLSLSGIVGLALGDSALFQSYVLIGPRLGTLLMASNPVIGAIIAWAILGERLSLAQAAGIFFTVTGITLVVLERSAAGVGDRQAPHTRKQYLLGVLCGLGGALGQAGGLVLAKKGLAGDFPALSGVVIRMLAALVVIWTVTLLTGKGRATLAAARQGGVMRSILSGTVVGPVIGVWLSLIAVQAAYVGIASTLMALTPIFLLPIARWGYKENVSSRAVVGTLVAIAGLAVIFIAPGVT